MISCRIIRLPGVEAFFSLIAGVHPFKVGLDSCNVPGAIRFCKNILPQSLDTCEGGRFSCYIDSDLTLLPCSFDQSRQYAVQLNPLTIEEGWNSLAFEAFRDKLRSACPGCLQREQCILASQMREFQTLDEDGTFKKHPEYPEFAWLEGLECVSKFILAEIMQAIYECRQAKQSPETCMPACRSG